MSTPLAATKPGVFTCFPSRHPSEVEAATSKSWLSPLPFLPALGPGAEASLHLALSSTLHLLSSYRPYRGLRRRLLLSSPFYRPGH